MIVLWRRIRGAVGGIGPTEWAMLAIETLAVVGGIVIAFQLQEWASDRREARQVDRISAALLEEARTATAFIWQNVRSWRETIEEGEAVAATLAAGECPSAEALAALQRLDHYDTVDPPSGVYDELVATAGLSSLEDPSARLGVDFYRNARSFYLAENDNFRAQRWQIVREDDPAVRIVRDADADLGKRVEIDPERVCADPEFSDRVAKIVGDQAYFQELLRELYFTDAAFMCVALAHSLGQKCSDPEWFKAVVGEEDARMIDRVGRERQQQVDL
ncbi:hypothetical protein WJT74_12040 [Sphingomicrobium sp. XHP0239]|uniref:hypothetical protein n=1 Tax=Sphingomicrobium maritimum TaxID=3133972 RepID=UPI0031CCA028